MPSSSTMRFIAIAGSPLSDIGMLGAYADGVITMIGLIAASANIGALRGDDNGPRADGPENANIRGDHGRGIGAAGLGAGRPVRNPHRLGADAGAHGAGDRGAKQKAPRALQASRPELYDGADPV